jgi:hypothetical protein
MPTKCPKCPITVYKTGTGWNFDPSFGCIDLKGTQWGRTSEFQWCPTLAAAMRPDAAWPGVTQREHVEKAIAAAVPTPKTKNG